MRNLIFFPNGSFPRGPVEGNSPTDNTPGCFKAELPKSRSARSFTVGGPPCSHQSVHSLGFATQAGIARLPAAPSAGPGVDGKAAGGSGRQQSPSTRPRSLSPSPTSDFSMTLRHFPSGTRVCSWVQWAHTGCVPVYTRSGFENHLIAVARQKEKIWLCKYKTGYQASAIVYGRSESMIREAASAGCPARTSPAHGPHCPLPPSQPENRCLGHARPLPVRVRAWS